MPCFTAWYGIRHICKPKAGETVFVSAATGAVGQVAGQLAKLAGARVVGCAGDDDKCVWAVREAGYDACFNHAPSATTARCSTSSARRASTPTSRMSAAGSSTPCSSG